jgi:hypothetical protein
VSEGILELWVSEFLEHLAASILSTGWIDFKYISVCETGLPGFPWYKHTKPGKYYQITIKYTK